jgi:hypothetical protein
MKKKPVIGIDFDNTIISYDSLLFRLALEQDLIGTGTARNKKIIRDTIRGFPEGELLWQKLQARIYGHRISEAGFVDGVQEFLGLCGTGGIRLYIVSHKTEYSGVDEERVNLREAAMKWMESKGLFRTALRREDVFFESSRAEKCGRIRALGCTHFIDDLEEVFTEPAFPTGVEKILYLPGDAAAPARDIRTVRTWDEIKGMFFGAAH